MEDIVIKAKKYAVSHHQKVNHMYGDHPYETHLNMVIEVAYKYLHLVPEEIRNDVLAGCWVHDIIEDCRQTYNDVRKATSEYVAELAFALTNEKGKNRDNRANTKYYNEMKLVPGAVFIKLCDRIANIKFSIINGSSMASKYQKEHDKFCNELYTKEYEPMFSRMRELLKIEI